MKQIISLFIACGLAAVISAAPAPAGSTRWSIKGEMSEACTCQVPCTCNFGQGASPHHYCWSLASFQIEKGRYGRVNLSGLRFVRAHGGAGIVWYIDSRATARQAEALRAITEHLTGAAWTERWPDRIHFETAQIGQEAAGNTFQIKIGNQGGFEAREITGGDGKNPIVVENMTAWNVQHDIKGKTTRLYYKDTFGNQFDLTDTNANKAEFDWTDKTPDYF